MALQKLTFDQAAVAARPRRRTLPPSIWALGLSAMFMDMSSELVHSLLPVLMVSVLGASMVTIGFLEGVAEATAAITKIFSGALSDYLGKRKFLVVLGYGLRAITKPVFPLAPSISWVFGARFSEAFLILRAQSVGLASGFVPMFMIVMNLVYAASAYPAGCSGFLFGRLYVPEHREDPQVVNNLQTAGQ